MTDTVSSAERSKIMSRIKGHGNKSTELRLIEVFKEYGIKGWRRGYPLYGRPDFVFPKERLAVFVDGCFWHGCEEHCRLPLTNQDYWKDKINKNIERDKKVTQVLKKKNWKIIRIWEHEFKKNFSQENIQRIQAILARERAAI